MFKPVLLYLRARARLINVSSVGSQLYCTSKAAAEGLTIGLAAELGAQGHTVDAVNPGPVQIALLDGVPKEVVEYQKKKSHLLGTG